MFRSAGLTLFYSPQELSVLCPPGFVPGIPVARITRYSFILSSCVVLAVIGSCAAGASFRLRGLCIPGYILQSMVFLVILSGL